jgi:hypothetical protein
MISKDEFDTLITCIEEAGYEARSYSGRGMCGDQCLGFTCNNPINGVLEVISAAMRELQDDVDHDDDDAVMQFADCVDGFIDYLKNSSTDNMGLDQIVYFPDIKWQE